MYQILSKKILSPDIKEFVVAAPEVAKKAQPGQFVIIRLDERGERIPLTIADYDRQQGTITIVVQEIGRTTRELGQLNQGDFLLDFVGPLGRPSELHSAGTVICIGGGVGVAPIYPQARSLYQQGANVLSIIGARSKDLLIWEDRMRAVSDELYITTDDGSYGRKGFVTDVLKDLLSEIKEISEVIAIGPMIMMKNVCAVTRPYGIKTMVSLNPVMVDGTGMCGACRVTVGGETKFACVDGPDFDGHLVDFDEQMRRQRFYHEEEKKALDVCGCGGEGKCRH